MLALLIYFENGIPTTVTDTISAPKETAVAAPKDSIAMQKAWEVYMTPSNVRKSLAKDNDYNSFNSNLMYRF